MHRYPWQIFAFRVLFLLMTFAHAQEPKNGSKVVATANYYPLEVGNEWQYRVAANDRNSVLVTRISKIEEIGKEKLARLESPVLNMSEHLTQTEKGVFRHRYNGADVSPPFRLLPYPATVGAKWEGEFTVEKENGARKYFGEIQSEETIDVPAGKFKAICLLIKLEENGKRIETTYWFAKDVGLVKQSFETAGRSVLMELEKFERANETKK